MCTISTVTVPLVYLRERHPRHAVCRVHGGNFQKRVRFRFSESKDSEGKLLRPGIAVWQANEGGSEERPRKGNAGGRGVIDRRSMIFFFFFF
jgi:hypothetical protein